MLGGSQIRKRSNVRRDVHSTQVWLKTEPDCIAKWVGVGIQRECVEGERERESERDGERVGETNGEEK